MKWKKADPIPRFEKVLRQRDAKDDQLNTRREKAKAIADEALQFALNSDEPDPETVADCVFA